jgi:hypothetical protein
MHATKVHNISNGQTSATAEPNNVGRNRSNAPQPRPKPSPDNLRDSEPYRSSLGTRTGEPVNTQPRQQSRDESTRIPREPDNGARTTTDKHTAPKTSPAPVISKLLSDYAHATANAGAKQPPPKSILKREPTVQEEELIEERVLITPREKNKIEALDKTPAVETQVFKTVIKEPKRKRAPGSKILKSQTINDFGGMNVEFLQQVYQQNVKPEYRAYGSYEQWKENLFRSLDKNYISKTEPKEREESEMSARLKLMRLWQNYVLTREEALKKLREEKKAAGIPVRKTPAEDRKVIEKEHPDPHIVAIRDEEDVPFDNAEEAKSKGWGNVKQNDKKKSADIEKLVQKTLIDAMVDLPANVKSVGVVEREQRMGWKKGVAVSQAINEINKKDNQKEYEKMKKQETPPPEYEDEDVEDYEEDEEDYNDIIYDENDNEN